MAVVEIYVLEEGTHFLYKSIVSLSVIHIVGSLGHVGCSVIETAEFSMETSTAPLDKTVPCLTMPSLLLTVPITYLLLAI